jgi:protein-disulfide isomerase
MPLESIHPLAFDASKFAVCAHRQGKFWEMHARMFANQGRLDKGSLREYVGPVGLDSQSFDFCLNDEKVAESIRSDAELASSLGITSTPTFFIGRRLPDGRVKVVARASGQLDQVQQAIATALAPEVQGSGRLIAGTAVMSGIILFVVAKRRSRAGRARAVEA